MILQKYRNLRFFFFYKNMYGRFAGRPKKDGRFNERPYYRGGYKAGFHFTL